MVGWHTVARVSRARIIYLSTLIVLANDRVLLGCSRVHLGRFLCKLMGGRGRIVLAVYRQAGRNGKKLCREVTILYATSGG